MGKVKIGIIGNNSIFDYALFGLSTKERCAAGRKVFKEILRDCYGKLKSNTYTSESRKKCLIYVLFFL